MQLPGSNLHNKQGQSAAFSVCTGAALSPEGNRALDELLTGGSADKRTQASTGPFVLLVEDESFLQRLYRRGLVREGFRVAVAPDGASALRMLNEFDPDVVVLDLLLPRGEAIELLQRMRSVERLDGVPVLVLSNGVMEALSARALRAGASRGLLKAQCTPSKLTSSVRALLSLPPGVPGQNAGKIRAGLARPLRLPNPAKVRAACLECIKSQSSPRKLELLEDLFREVRAFAARAGLSGMTKLSEVATALEAVLFELVCGNCRPTPPVLQTIAQAVDGIEYLVETQDTRFAEPRQKARVLVVDDDSLCAFMTSAVLKRANFEVISAEDPAEALKVLEKSSFELVLLDIDMPKLDGFQLCQELRCMSHHRNTHVIFVTLSGEFESRAQSVLAGGNDLLTKPVFPAELILKATLQALNAGRGRTLSAVAIDMWQHPN